MISAISSPLRAPGLALRQERVQERNDASAPDTRCNAASRPAPRPTGHDRLQRQEAGIAMHQHTHRNAWRCAARPPRSGRRAAHQHVADRGQHQHLGLAAFAAAISPRNSSASCRRPNGKCSVMTTSGRSRHRQHIQHRAAAPFASIGCPPSSSRSRKSTPSTLTGGNCTKAKGSSCRHRPQRHAAARQRHRNGPPRQSPRQMLRPHEMAAAEQMRHAIRTRGIIAPASRPRSACA
jgi:hypothetical protein